MIKEGYTMIKKVMVRTLGLILVLNQLSGFNMEVNAEASPNSIERNQVTPIITTTEINNVSDSGEITVDTSIYANDVESVKGKTVTFVVKENSVVLDTIYADNQIITGTEGIREDSGQYYYDIPVTFYSSRIGLADEDITYAVTASVDGHSVEAAIVVKNTYNPNLPTAVIIDNVDEGFTSAPTVTFGVSTTGGSTFPTRHGVNHLYSKSADGYGRWTPTLEPGSYRVLLNRLIHSGNTTKATATVVAGGETHTQDVNLASGNHGYMNLGIYTFTGSGDEYLELHNDSSVRQLRLDSAKFVVDLPAPPQATDLVVEPKMESYRVKDTLVCGYDYSDDNGDVEAGSQYRLLRATHLASENWELITSGTVTGNDDLHYVLTSGDESHYIKLEITPKNNSSTHPNGYTRSYVIGKLVAPALPEAPPVATHVKIEGDPFLLSRINGSYTYTDANHDKEDGTTFEWVTSDSNTVNAEWTVVKSGETFDNKLMQYITANGDCGKYIKLRITPKNKATQLSVGDMVESNVIGPIDSTYIIDNASLKNYYESENFGSSSYGGKSYQGSHRWNQIKGVHCKWYMTGTLVGEYKVSYYYPAYHDNNVLMPGIEIGSGNHVQYSGLLDFTGFTSENNGTWIELGTFKFRPDEEAYVKLINTTGKVIRADAVKFERMGDYDVLPDIKNLKFGGSLAPGHTLVGSYDYMDINGDLEDGTTYKWLRGEHKNTDQWVEVGAGTTTATDTITYTLQQEDRHQYIKLVVTPQNANGVGASDEVMMGPVAESDQAPEARAVTLNGKPWIDYTLTATYDYYDANFDSEGESMYAWYYTDDYDENEKQEQDEDDNEDEDDNDDEDDDDDEDDEDEDDNDDDDDNDNEKDKTSGWVLIESGLVHSLEDITKVITSDYKDKYIKVGITPKNEQLNGHGEEVFSQVIGPFKKQIVEPQVADVHVTGQMVNAENIKGVAVDGKIEAAYTYTHELSYNENHDATQYQWYVGNTANGAFEKISGATSPTFTPTEEVAGRYIKLSVISASVDGQISDEVFSEALPVNWRLAFVDEFDYVAVDGYSANLTDKWIVDSAHRVLGNPVTHSARIPENVEVSDGLFKIHTRKEHLDKYPFEHTWTTGNVMTRETMMKYGYYEASYKLAEATGLNQSFWAMTQNGLYESPKFLELDFNEGHYPYELSTNLHWHGKDENGKPLRLTNHHMYYPLGTGEATFGNQFVKIGGMLRENNGINPWDSPENSDTYQVFVNDELIRSTKSIPYDPDFLKIYLSVAVLPGFAGYLDEEAADGSIMEVDYVRYYTPIDMLENR